MAKLTASQIGAKLNKTAYTIKRWYKWYEQLTEEEKQEYIKNGMPELPKYETVGATNWRYWDEQDLEKLQKFSDWVPHTRGGVMGIISNKKEEK